jgi:hypothetical protein
VSESLLILAFQDDPKDKYVGAATMTFGLTLSRAAGTTDGRKPRRLTYEARGRTNNTCYRLDGREFLLGYEGGHWQTLRAAPAPGDSPKRPNCRSLWLHQDAPVAITQSVSIVRGPQSRQPDTCLVRYSVENRDKVAHKVGLRFLLDTFVGSRDGVPFAVPGIGQWCDTTCDRQGADVPDFLQALEADDLANPGTVAHLSLRLSGKLEAPGRVALGAWPDEELQGLDPRAQGNLTRWEVPPFGVKDHADSAVTLYWPEKDLAPGARRELGFAYGLGAVAAAEGRGQLGLAVGGVCAPGGDWTVTAYVKAPVAGQTLTLELPPGLTLIGGPAVAPVPPLPAASRSGSLVTWRVRSAPGQATSYRVQVRSSTGLSQALTVKVQAHRAFE